MSVKDRIRDYLKFKGLSERSFALSIGVGTAYIGNIRVSIAADKLDRIAVIYPDLNLTWLITGDGEMLNSEESKNNEVSKSQEIDKLMTNKRKSIFDVLTPEKVEELSKLTLTNSPSPAELYERLIITKDEVIASSQRENELLKREAETLREMIEMLKNQLHGNDKHSNAV